MTEAELDAMIDRLLTGRLWCRSPYVVINGVRHDVPTWLKKGESPEMPDGGTYAGQRPPRYCERARQEGIVT